MSGLRSYQAWSGTSVLEGRGVGDVTDVDGVNECFAPVAKVHRGGVEHALNHLEVDSNGLFSDTILFGGVGICCFVLDTVSFTKVGANNTYLAI